MTFMGTGGISLVVIGIVDLAKRFIPERHVKWANPVLALIVAFILALAKGGTGDLVSVAVEALVGAGAAVTAHAGAKAIGVGIGTERP